MAFSNLLQDLFQPWLKIFVWDISLDHNFYLRSGIGLPTNYVLTLTDPITGQGTWQPAQGGGGGGVSSLIAPDNSLSITPGSTGALSITATGDFTNKFITTNKSISMYGLLNTMGLAANFSNNFLSGTSVTIDASSLDIKSANSQCTGAINFLGATTITGDLIIPTSAAANAVLTSDADGNATWQPATVKQVQGDGTTTVVTTPSPDVYQVAATGAFGPSDITTSGSCSAHQGFTSQGLAAGLTLNNAASTNFFLYHTANATATGMYLALSNPSTGSCDWIAAPTGGVSSLVTNGAGTSIDGTLGINNNGLGIVTLSSTGNFIGLGASAVVQVPNLTVGTGGVNGNLRVNYGSGATVPANGKILVCQDDAGNAAWETASSEGVTSISNTDGSLTITGTSGPVTINSTGEFPVSIDCQGSLTVRGGSGIAVTAGINCGSNVHMTGGVYCEQGPNTLYGTTTCYGPAVLNQGCAIAGALSATQNASLSGGAVVTGGPLIVGPFGLGTTPLLYGARLYVPRVRVDQFVFPQTPDPYVLNPQSIIDSILEVQYVTGSIQNKMIYQLPTAAQFASYITGTLGLNYFAGMAWDWDVMITQSNVNETVQVQINQPNDLPGGDTSVIFAYWNLGDFSSTSVGSQYLNSPPDTGVPSRRKFTFLVVGTNTNVRGSIKVYY